MLKVELNRCGDDNDRRAAVHSGSILFYQASDASRALCNLAREMALEAFDGLDPEHAQESLPVERFVDIVAGLKSRFTNADQTKELLRDYLVSMGADPRLTYFDVPRLRVVPHSHYLTSGVSYAYKAHRDIWYASPPAQINWWMPAWDVTTERTMAFFPAYFDRAFPNTSEDFDYGDWVRIGRAAATSQIDKDTRKHPLPLKELTAEDEFRFAANSGETIVFSASHLHATAPNTSDTTRFSIDFRSLNLDDLRTGRGGPTTDCRAQGSTLGDFLSVEDFSPIELELT